MNKNKRQFDKGFALLMVMIIVVMASVMGLSYLAIASIKVQSAENFVACSSARSLAESGLEHAMYILQNAPDSIAASSQSNPLGPYYVDGSTDRYVIYGLSDSSGHFVLTAEGTSGTITQKASATAVRSSAPTITTTRAATMTRTLVKLPTTLTINGDFHVNGKLTNYARIMGSASGTTGVQDPLNRIDHIVTAGVQTVPTLAVNDYKNYHLQGASYAATTLSAVATFPATSPLTNGGSITTSNPGGVVALTPVLGNTILPDNFKFKGTLVTSGNLVLDGGSIELTAVDGFPAIVCNGNIVITTRTRVTINGTVLMQGNGGIVPAITGSAGSTSVINGSITGITSGYDYNLAGSHVLNYNAGRSSLYDVTDSSTGSVTVHFESWIR